MKEPKSDPLIGKVFDDRFLILDKLGKGGMGSVYRARQLTVGREVALKVLNPDLAEDVEAAGRFVREAKVASRLRHPNTIVVFDFGSCAEGLYIVMELLEGESLYQRLRRDKSIPVRETARIGAAIARSLDEAHSLGIVHRDLKPGNIMMSAVHGGGEIVKVLDFGVARFFLEQSSRAKDGMFETNKPMMVGTLQYMAPEQIRGAPTDARTDVYALGIMLYELACGRRPFDGESPVHTMQRQLEDVAAPLPGEFPEAFRTLIARMLAKSPDERPASGAEVAVVLEAIAGAPAGAPLPDSAGPSRSTSSAGRRPDADRMAVPESEPAEAPGGWDRLERPPSDSMHAAPTRAVQPGSPLRQGPPGAEFGTISSSRREIPVTHYVGIQEKPRKNGLIVFVTLGVLGLVGAAWYFVSREAGGPAAVSTLVLQCDPERCEVRDADSGAALGTTPLTLTGGPKAPKTVVVVANAFRPKTVPLEFPPPGNSKTARVRLTPAPQILFETTSGPGATVTWVDRQLVLGVTPFTWSVPDDVLKSGRSVTVRFTQDALAPRQEEMNRDHLAAGRPLSVKLSPVAPAPHVRQVEPKRGR